MTKRMTKREIRETAFVLLFEKSFRDDPIETLYEVAEEVGELSITDKVRALTEGVLAEEAALDELIASYSTKRAFSRIARVNVILLRIAMYELRHRPDTPVNVVISEAVALSQIYAAQEDTAFINGVLASYIKTLPPRSTGSTEET